MSPNPQVTPQLAIIKLLSNSYDTTPVNIVIGYLNKINAARKRFTDNQIKLVIQNLDRKISARREEIDGAKGDKKQKLKSQLAKLETAREKFANPEKQGLTSETTKFLNTTAKSKHLLTLLKGVDKEKANLPGEMLGAVQRKINERIAAIKESEKYQEASGISLNQLNRLISRLEDYKKPIQEKYGHREIFPGYFQVLDEEGNKTPDVIELKKDGRVKILGWMPSRDNKIGTFANSVLNEKCAQLGLSVLFASATIATSAYMGHTGKIGSVMQIGLYLTGTALPFMERINTGLKAVKEQGKRKFFQLIDSGKLGVKDFVDTLDRHYNRGNISSDRFESISRAMHYIKEFNIPKTQSI